MQISLRCNIECEYVVAYINTSTGIEITINIIPETFNICLVVVRFLNN